MKKVLLILSVLVFALSAFGQASTPLKLVQKIPMPNVDGFLDHMGVDIKGQRLFVPGEFQKVVEVIDLRTGKVIHTITGFQHPHTVLYRASLNELFITDQALGCLVFRGNTYQHIKTIRFGPGADNAYYDPTNQDFYVTMWNHATHSGNSKIAIVDTRTAALVGEIPIPGGGDIQGIAFDPSSPRMFLDIASRSEIDVIDLTKRAIVATWPVPEGPWPYAIALDSADHRLFVASRIEPFPHYFRPGKLLVLDSETGRLITTVKMAGGADEAFYDAARRRIYIPGGDGFVDVIQQIDPDHYRTLARVPTGVMAKTGLFVPELNRFYAAVPERRVFVKPLKIPKVEPAEVEVLTVTP